MFFFSLFSTLLFCSLNNNQQRDQNAQTAINIKRKQSHKIHMIKNNTSLLQLIVNTINKPTFNSSSFKTIIPPSFIPLGLNRIEPAHIIPKYLMSQLPRPKELNDRSPSRFSSKLPNLQGAPNHDPVILLEQDKVFLDLNADERDELGSEEAVEILEVVGERVREAEEETQVLGAQLHRGETPL